jgi:hypothetical protein
MAHACGRAPARGFDSFQILLLGIADLDPQDDAA